MLEAISVFVPTDDILQKFNACCEVYQEKIEMLKKQIELSTETRDRLLPKLMSEEIEV